MRIKRGLCVGRLKIFTHWGVGTWEEPTKTSINNSQTFQLSYIEILRVVSSNKEQKMCERPYGQALYFFWPSPVLDPRPRDVPWLGPDGAGYLHFLNNKSGKQEKV